MDVYGYCLDDPVNLVDPLGLEGGSTEEIAKPKTTPALKKGVKKGLGVVAEEAVKKGIKKGIDELGGKSVNESTQNLKDLGKACISGPTWWTVGDYATKFIPGGIGQTVGVAASVPMCGFGMLEYSWRRNKGESREDVVRDYD